MQKYYLIGYNLKHSMSEPIHKKLFETDGCNGSYEILDFPLEEIKSKVDWLRENADGFNCTIPYKQEIIPFLDGIEPRAELYGAVNTVKVQDGKLYGYNTDYIGFGEALKQSDISIENQCVAVLGNGGVARMMAMEAVFNGANQVFICARAKDRACALADEINEKVQDRQIVQGIELSDMGNYSFDIILNGTPVGMWPNMNACPVDEKIEQAVKGVFDTIYNPLNTNLILKCKKAGVKCSNGLSMLVHQAVAAQIIWRGAEFENSSINNIIDDMSYKIIKDFEIPIVLTGFMGCGKSTVGKALADKIGYEFVDIDEEIEKELETTIPQIFESHGETFFRKTESEVFAKNLRNGVVIATGGGLAVQERNIELMNSKYCIVINMEIEFETVKKRIQGDENRPLAGNAENLYNERKKKYLETADFSVDANTTIEKTIQNIVRRIIQ